jgi:predicted PurR-regulated permease PerM
MADGNARELTKKVLLIVAVVLAVAGVLWLIWTLSTLLIVLTLSAFLAYLISPLVDFVCGSFTLFGRPRRVPRGWAILIVYALIGVIAATAIAIAAPRLAGQFSELTKQMSSYATTGGLQAWATWFNRLPLDESVRVTLQQLMTRAVEAMTTGAQAAAMSVLAWVSSLPWLVLIPIFAFFLLKDAEGLRDGLISLGRDRDRRMRIEGVLHDINDALAAYIRAQLLACIIVAIISSIGFMVVGVPYALVLGLAAGVMECIPIVGPAIVAVVVFVLSLFHSLVVAIAALVFLGVVRILEDYVIYPRLIGRHIDLPPFAIILAVLAGAEIGGVTGVLLAIPVLATSIILVRHLRADAAGGAIPSPSPAAALPAAGASAAASHAPVDAER